MRYDSSSALARALRISPQKMRNWETQRNRADVEDLERWAAQLGYQLVITLTRESPAAQQGELTMALARLDGRQARTVRRVIRLLPWMSARDHQMLVGLIEAFEESSPVGGAETGTG